MGKTFRIVLIVVACVVAASGIAGGFYLFYIVPRQEAIAVPFPDDPQQGLQAGVLRQLLAQATAGRRSSGGVGLTLRAHKPPEWLRTRHKRAHAARLRRRLR